MINRVLLVLVVFSVVAAHGLLDLGLETINDIGRIVLCCSGSSYPALLPGFVVGGGGEANCLPNVLHLGRFQLGLSNKRKVEGTTDENG